MQDQISIGAAFAGLVMALVPGVVGLVYAVGAYVKAKTALLQATLAAQQAGTAASESVKTNVLLEAHQSQATERNLTTVTTLSEMKKNVEEVKKATNGMKDELVKAAYEAGKSGAPCPSTVPVQ